jgi:hypothetical protein
MRSPSSRIQIGSFSTKRECMQTHIRSIKNHNFIEIKLLHFSLKITRMRWRRCFKRYIKFAEAFHSMIKDIHLTLEVKTSFNNSTPVTDSNTESITRSLDFHWKPSSASSERRDRNLHIKSYKAKLDRLRSTRLSRHDQAIKLLYMPRVQVVNDS